MIAGRYAKALFELACGEKNEVILSGHYRELIAFLDKNRFMKSFLENPVISSEKKQDLAEKLWGIKYSGILYDFIKLLIEKRRFQMFFHIYDEYDYLLKEKQKIADVHIETAMRLEKDALKRFSEVFSAYLKKNVVLTQKVNPRILAGVKVTIENEIMDFSAAGQLNEIKKSLQAV